MVWALYSTSCLLGSMTNIMASLGRGRAWRAGRRAGELNEGGVSPLVEYWSSLQGRNDGEIRKSAMKK